MTVPIPCCPPNDPDPFGLVDAFLAVAAPGSADAERVYLAWLVSLEAALDPALAAAGLLAERERSGGVPPTHPVHAPAGAAGRHGAVATPCGRGVHRRPIVAFGAVMTAKIPATIVTGFLGAGKTSLIRHLVEHAGGKRLALLINEFGDLGVDKALLGGCGIAGCGEEDVIELANGCICCTVADDFLPAMRTILARDPAPDHIVIETSGLALPKPLVAAFNWPEVRSRLTVDGVLVVADAAAVLAGRFAPRPGGGPARARGRPGARPRDPARGAVRGAARLRRPRPRQQGRSGGAGDRAAIEAAVRAELRPGVRLVWTSHGRLDPAVALGLGIAAEDDLANRPSHHDGGEEHGHDEFESFVLAVPPLADPESLAARLRAAIRAHDVLRVKGFLAVTGKPLRHVVQAVGERIDRYYDRPWRADERQLGELVVIGLRGLDRAAIGRAVLG